MSVKVSSWVWENGPRKPAEKLLLLALADHANDDGLCYPSLKRLAVLVGTTERYVRRLRDTLLEDGFIELIQKGGNSRSNLYRIITSPGGSIVPNDETENGTIVPKGGVHSSQKVNHSSGFVNHRPPEPSLTIIEPKQEPPFRGPVAASPRSRKRTRKDDFFDALVSAFGQPATSSEKAFIAKAANELAKIENAQPSDVQERFDEAKRRWKGIAFSPQALLKWWTSLADRTEVQSELKGNAQIGKNFFDFDPSTDESIYQNLGVEVHND